MSTSGRELLAEWLGTSLLLFIVVGSGIAVERLGADPAMQLFAHAVIVGAGLSALIAFLAPVSGAHFNPVVTIGFWRTGDVAGRRAGAYVVAQLAGGFAGVAAANATFGESWLSLASTVRTGFGRPAAELVGTFVLVLLILGLVRSGRSGAVAPAAGAWVAAIVLATVSTGFANPAVTAARVFTDTYTGIAPGGVPTFLFAQVAAGVLAATAAGILFPAARRGSEDVPEGARS